VQGKCNKTVTSAMPPFHHSENKNSKNSINFFSRSQLPNKLCGLNSDYYYVTLPIHSHGEVTVVIANLGVRIFAILLLIIMNLHLGMVWSWHELAS